MTNKNKPEVMPTNWRLRGVGKQIAKYLARMNIHSVTDLLFHLPIRYQDRTQVQAIKQLSVGTHAVVQGVITHVQTIQKGKTKILCELQDATSRIYLRFFHLQSFYLATFKPGVILRCYSEVRLGTKGLEMVHPEYQVISLAKPCEIDPYLTPFYGTTEGLSQYVLRKISKEALNQITQILPEIIPDQIRENLALPTIKDAVQFIHRPPNTTDILALMANKTMQQKRLAFEELLAHRISLLTLKKKFQTQKSVALLQHDELTKNFIAGLPFQLTQAQVRATLQIQQDLNRATPMLRLVQGDVGSGKTVVAAYALLQAIANGYQGALMAPTELLARQHYAVLSRLFASLNMQVVLLSSQIKNAARRSTLTAIKEGQAQIIVGTHALFQQEVEFAQLALVVVDEQHRFGVHQRALLRAKGQAAQLYPHQLVMTATPIPRTLAMSFYADLDCSIIDELPKGRKPIITSVIANTKREAVIERIANACRDGRQGYWVCPLIEESEVLSCESAIKTHDYLTKCLPNLNIGLIHGRMLSADKHNTMAAFQAGQIHLLVATTVIEVGVDVANATIMVIENAERLGLSQLHQLRGRVGRSSLESHCLLLYQHPLTDVATERLKVMRETTDGFKIAERDLQLRGPGEVLGTKQTGELEFKIADLLRDSHLLKDVQQAAEVLMKAYPEQISPLLARWFSTKAQYGDV